MKTNKKIVFGLALALFTVMFVFAGPNKVSAKVIESQKEIEDGLSSLQFKNRAVIEGTFAGQLIQFVDEDPYDKTYNYKPLGDLFCSTGDTVNGINIQNNAIATIGSVGSSVLAHVDLDYSTKVPPVANHGLFSEGCKSTEKDGHGYLRAGIITGGRAFVTFEWSRDLLNEVPAIKGASPLIQLGSTAKDKNFYVKDADARCYGGKAVLLTNDNLGTRYTFRNGPFTDGDDAHDDDVLKAYFEKNNDCFISSSHPMTVFGVRGVQTTSTSTVSGDNTSDCVKNNNSGLEWLFCPVTSLLGASAGALENVITNQLDYDVSGTLSNNGEAHAAWSIIKNLATAILVIVMLFMVFSQAIGNGFFEAYTVKKMLPRLVIAVILMQISWELCKWLISLANDLGNGLGELLAAPFGGVGNLDLNSIVSKMDGNWAENAQVLIPALLFAGVVLGAIALPGVFVLALSIFLAVFVAIIMLMFRNVLILTLVIFAPIALLLWIMPGQGMQKYWKLWSDNFTKLLMLFPLIIAIIYSGRIFASIAAGASSGDDGDILVFLMILVAYFGPYFIIFKAYSWGGGIMSATGGMVEKGSKGIQRASSPLLKSVGDRAQGNLADRYAIQSSKGRELRSQRDRARELGKTAEADALDKQYQALEKKDRFKRGFYRVASGNPLPTTRSQVETLAKASAYKEDLVKKKMGLIHTDYVEELARNGGDVKGAKEYIRDKYDIGNTATEIGPNGKPRIATNELGDGKSLDKYTERAVKNWYVDTKSAMELGDEGWRLGEVKDTVDKAEFMAGGRLARLNKKIGNPNATAADIDREATRLSKVKRTVGYKTDQNLTLEDIVLHGKRPKFDVAKTTGFMAMMNADPNRYAYVATNLPTLQPFNQELGGGPKRTDYLPELRDASGAVVRPQGSKYEETIARLHQEMPPAKAAAVEAILARNDDKAHQLATYLAEDARAVKWMDNMESPTGFATVRPEHYQIMADVKANLHKMGDDELGIESQAAKTMRAQMDKLAQGEGIEGKSILQKLMGGKMSASSSIDKIFEEPGYLENKLNVPLSDDVVVAAGGRIRGGNLGSQQTIEVDATTGQEPPERKELRFKIIQDSQRDPRQQTVAQEFAKSLGEMEGYADAAHSVEQQELKKVFSEIRDSAVGDPNSARGFNSLITNIVARLNARVERAAENAVAQHKDPAEVRRIRANAQAAADREIAEYEAQRIGVPTPNQYPQPIGPEPDPSILTVPHGTPPTIVTPGGPGWEPPDSSRLPRP